MFPFFAKCKQPTPPEPAVTQSRPALVEYEIIASVLSDVGCQRATNEDSASFFRPHDDALRASKGSLAIVADGMGGHAAGEVASRIAVEVIRRAYYESKLSASEALQKAFVEANEAIYRASQVDRRLAGMGTTCTALVLQGGAALCAHVGDSRLYLQRNGALYQLSEDHSFVREMVKHGMLTNDQAREHSEKNVILRALGTRPKVEVEMWEKPFSVQPGDALLLCSDGLSDLVTDEEIQTIVGAEEPHLAAEKLIALARERGGHDNITVGVLQLQTAREATATPLPTTRETEALV